MTTRDVDQMLEELRERYREKFERELDVLAARLRDAEHADYGRSQLEAVQGLAHRLMGTSGSYGLDASSAALGRMQERLDRLLAAEEADVGTAWSDIESELAAARAGTRC